MYIRDADSTFFIKEFYICSDGSGKGWVYAVPVNENSLQLFYGNIDKANEFYEFVLSVIARGENLISIDELQGRFDSVQSVTKAVKLLFGRGA